MKNRPNKHLSASSQWVHIAYLDGHFVLGEGSAPQQLVDAVDGEESCDGGTQVIGHCDPHRVGCNHLHNRKKLSKLQKW